MTNHDFKGITWKPKLNHPNGNCHTSQDRKKRAKFGQMWRFYLVFFDSRGVVHHEFLPQSRTVNKKYYLQVMRNLREAIRQKRSDLWKNTKIGFCTMIMLLPAHTSFLVREFLTKNNTIMLPQPPYSPDFPPVTFSCSLIWRGP